ncbi:hypothetical protein [Kitasatospora sp. NPDC004531]
MASPPPSNTSFNYVVRSAGYSLGSAIGSLALAAGTGPGQRLPTLAGPAAIAVTY